MGTKSLPRQRHPSGVPWVDSALWCWRPPVGIQGGTSIFGPLPFWRDCLEMKKGAWGLGLTNFWKTHLNQFSFEVQCNVEIFLFLCYIAHLLVWTTCVIHRHIYCYFYLPAEVLYFAIEKYGRLQSHKIQSFCVVLN